MFLNNINMWKSIRITCLQMFLLIMDINVINGSEEESKATHTISENLSKLMLKQENGQNGQDVSSLAYSEPGFNFTEEEMVKLKIWPGAIIPYYIDTLSFDSEYRKGLNLFLETVGRTVGVQFMKLVRPPTDENNRWVFFINRRGALSSDGYTTKDFTSEGVQKVVLGYNSPYNGELFETTLAILGVPPQHNAPNRDEHITVKFNNIMPGKKQLFEKLKDDEWLFHDLDYDYLSAGHYGLHKHSVGGFATIETKKEIDGIGNGQGFSYLDTLKIRMLYNFISKSRSKLIRKSDCQKMFQPGPKFRKFKPDKSNSLKPRRKPNKYLGKPDDGQDQSSDGNQPHESGLDSESQDLNASKGKLKRWKPKKPKPPKKEKSTKKPKTTKKPKNTKKPKETKSTTEKSKNDGSSINIDSNIDIDLNGMEINIGKGDDNKNKQNEGTETSQEAEAFEEPEENAPEESED